MSAAYRDSTQDETRAEPLLRGEESTSYKKVGWSYEDHMEFLDDEECDWTGHSYTLC